MRFPIELRSFQAGSSKSPKKYYCQLEPAGSSALWRDYYCQLETNGIRSETVYVIGLEGVKSKRESLMIESQLPAWEDGSSYSVRCRPGGGLVMNPPRL